MKFLNSKFYRDVYIICILLAIGLIVYIFIQANNNQKTLSMIEEEKSELLLKIDEYKEELIVKDNTIEDLTAQIILLNEKLSTSGNHTSKLLYLNEFDLNELNLMGITDVSAVANDLRDSIEVIKTSAVLGGTMRFEDIYLLNSNHVYATISDGHILGFGIYKFEIDKNSNFVWESLYEDIF